MAEENKTIKTLGKLKEEIEKFNETLYEFPEIDGYYNDLVRDIESSEKMTKKQRKELALKTLKERMPKIYALLFETNLISEAIKDKIKDLQDELDERLDEVDTLESDKEELEERIDNLR
ncbi:hypothetical protein CCP3SC1AL1_520006 [Gammaproteobacteria bacterium]